MPRKLSENADEVCDVCSEAIVYFAIGKCDHPVCFKCSTRMRALCADMTCPICRTDLPQVIFTKTKRLFEKILYQKFKNNRRHHIYFEDASVEEAYKTLLSHRCQICRDRPPERNFMSLKTHMSKEHSLYYCDICVTHLKVFSCERNCYSRSDLARHRRVGDASDKSHKGHPLCEFCDERYLDNDELLRHLRKEHYFCHFCDTDGSNQYYSGYELLFEHFSRYHFVCMEDKCAEAQFTNVFQSSIDLTAHKAHNHSSGLKRGQIKQNRTLDIEINLVPRPSKPGGRRDRQDRGNEAEELQRPKGRGRGRFGRSRRDDDDDDLARGISASLAEVQKKDTQAESDADDLHVDDPEDFPAIGAVASGDNTDKAPSGGQTMAKRFAHGVNMSVKETSMNDFPALSAQALQQHAKKTPVRANMVWKFNPYLPQAEAESHAPNEPEKPRMQSKPKIQEVEEDFPALPGGGSQVPFPSKPVRSFKPVSKVGDKSLSGSEPSGITAPKQASPQNSGAKPTLSSIGNILTSNVSSGRSSRQVGISTRFNVHGNSPNIQSDSDFPQLGGGANVAGIGTWVKKETFQESRYVPKSYSSPEVTETSMQSNAMQNPKQSEKAFDPEEDFPSLGQSSSNVPVSGTWVVKGKQSNRIKQKPSALKTPAQPSSNLVGKSFKVQSAPKITTEKNIQCVPKATVTEKSKEVIAVDDFSKKSDAGNVEDDAFITVTGKKKKSDPVDDDGVIDGNKGGKKKKKKKKGKTPLSDEGKENTDEMVLGYALAAFEDMNGKGLGSENILKEADKTEVKNKKKLKRVPKSEQTTLEETDGFSEVGRCKNSAEIVQKETFDENDHVRVISNRNMGNVEKLAHANNFTLLEEVSESDEATLLNSYKEVSRGRKGDASSNQNVPSFDKDNFPALHGGGPGPMQQSWMQKPKEYKLNDFPSFHETHQSDPIVSGIVDEDEAEQVPSFEDDDFPTLGGSRDDAPHIALSNRKPTTKKPPPGFSKSKVKDTSKPPPGFAGPISLSAIASSLGNPKIDPPPKPAIVCPPPVYLYSLPENFQERNQQLLMDFHLLLPNQTKFDEFKAMSGKFRQNAMTALEYYTNCTDLMTEDSFLSVFQELMVLLPDIEKQHELYETHRHPPRDSKSGKKSRKLNVRICPTCSQILTEKDFFVHLCTPCVDAFPST